MANEYTGKDLYVKFGSTVLSSRYKSFEPNEEIGIVDASAGADAARKKLTTLEDGTASIELLVESGDATLWAAVDKGTEATLEWGPEDTASSNPKHTVNAIVKSRSRAFVHDDVTKMTVEFEFSGAVSDDTY